MHIEVATEADVPAMTELLTVLFQQEAEFKPNPEAQRRGLLRIIPYLDVGIVLVAKEGSGVLERLPLFCTVSTAVGERVVLLEDMVGGHAARGLGIGSCLLQEAILIDEEGRCRRITLLTDQSNLSAQRFHNRQGLETPSMIPLRLCLASGQSRSASI
jgi:GNAT superfamily N-acetyltransferase